MKVFVSEILPIRKGSLSNKITITLEKNVPYKIEMVPLNDKFIFSPETILFEENSNRSKTFRIEPKADTEIGDYVLLWEKKEASET